MLSKKPVVLLASYSGLPTLYHTSSQPGTSCCNPHTRPSRHTRHYAQHVSHPPGKSSEHTQCDREDLSWPDPIHPRKTPTPYQILSTQQDQVYTKHRFYHLVKLYHPDRCHDSSPVSEIPHAVRLERYRLLVAAHAILSDDAKRRAYDLWGHGWVGHQENPSSRPYGWTAERKTWPSGHDPMMNATWEDWERWYDREYGREQQNTRDLYMSNFSFIGLIFALVTLGGVMQGTRANMMTSSAMEHRDKVHNEASKQLARSKRATMSGDRNERIKTFLEHREAVLAGEDAYQRILPPSVVCVPDTVRKQ